MPPLRKDRSKINTWWKNTILPGCPSRVREWACFKNVEVFVNAAIEGAPTAGIVSVLWRNAPTHMWMRTHKRLVRERLSQLYELCHEHGSELHGLREAGEQIALALSMSGAELKRIVKSCEAELVAQAESRAREYRRKQEQMAKDAEAEARVAAERDAQEREGKLEDCQYILDEMGFTPGTEPCVDDPASFQNAIPFYGTLCSSYAETICTRVRKLAKGRHHLYNGRNAAEYNALEALADDVANLPSMVARLKETGHCLDFYMGVVHGANAIIERAHKATSMQ